MVETHNGALLSLEREGNPDVCYNADGTWGQYAGNEPAQKDPHGRILRARGTQSPEIQRDREWLVAARGRGRGNGSWCSMGTEHHHCGEMKTLWRVTAVKAA